MVPRVFKKSLRDVFPPQVFHSRVISLLSIFLLSCQREKSLLVNRLLEIKNSYKWKLKFYTNFLNPLQ